MLTNGEAKKLIELLAKAKELDKFNQMQKMFINIILLKLTQLLTTKQKQQREKTFRNPSVSENTLAQTKMNYDEQTPFTPDTYAN